LIWWDCWLWELGYAVCHQQPERILRFPGGPLFVCARDTGLFVSFFTALLVLSLLRGRKRAGMPPLPLLILAGCGLLFMAADALTSYTGLRESTNTLRFLSGFAAGAGLALPVAALVNRFVFGGDRSLKVASRAPDLVALCLALVAAATVYLWRPAGLYRFAQLWLLLSMLGTFWSLNLLLICLLREEGGEGFTWYRAGLALLLTALELGVSYSAHRAIQGRGPRPAAGKWV
jgi:uncharacterized membrane protein